MLSKENYFSKTKDINPAYLPKDLKAGYKYVKEATEDHTTWKYYEADPDIRSAVDAVMVRLGRFLAQVERERKEAEQARNASSKSQHGHIPVPDRPPAGRKPAGGTGYLAKERGKHVVIDMATGKKWANEHFETEEMARAFCGQNNIRLVAPPGNIRLVPSIGAGLALVKRIYNLQSGKKTVASVVNLITAIQKAHEKGQLDKTGEGGEVYQILKRHEKMLVDLYNDKLSDLPLDEPLRLTLPPKELAALKPVVDGTKQNPLARLILRFLGMQGKPVEAVKAKRLIEAINKETARGRAGKDNPRFTAMQKALESLEEHVAGKRKNLRLSKETLDGLHGILSACNCAARHPLAGFGPFPPVDAGKAYPTPSTEPKETLPRPSGFIIPPPVVNGRLAPISYPSHRPLTSHVPTYRFTGRWQGLFNQPTKGFSALVYGPPKAGKSTLAIDFAGYLARGFGRVLYASIEEGGRATVDERVSRLGVGHPGIEIANNLPADLSRYDFIITDSVSRGNLGLAQMQQLKADWPDKNFIFLFHTTKDGLPRGTNQFLHEVDVLVKVQDGAATADGRFGPGEMDLRFR